jgi:HAD superfamily hydrolase (TIGR01509 family)
MPALVIFDMDGVLVDSETLACTILRDHLVAAGVEISFAEVVRTFVGLSSTSSRVIYRDRFGISDPDAFQAQMRDVWRVEAAHKLVAMPHVAETIETIVAHERPICVASSTSMEGIANSLRVTGLARYFGDNVYSSQLVARGKPAPDLFLYAAERMGVAPEQAAVIEDSLHGIRAGKAAGMRVLAYAGGSHADAAAQAAEGVEVFADMRELPRRLGLISEAAR